MPDLLAKLLLSLEPEADAEPRAWADALWLAAWQWQALGIAPVAAPPPVVEPEEPSGPDDPGPIGLQEADDRTDPPSPLPPSEPRAEVAETGDVANIHLPGSGVSNSAESGPAVRQVRLPAAAALPGRSLLSRRLYPLRRRIPSRTQFVLDEDATVDQIAEGDAWLPVLRPKAERWLTCTLLVDDSLSMVYWRRTAIELQRMLVGLGAFRLVTLVRWDGEKAEPRLAGGQGEHLVLVLTDTTSTAWRDGRWWQALNGWGRGHFVGILSALPEPMWDGTALHVAQPAQLRRSRATLTNSSLEAKERDWADPPLPAGLRLPVATLEPDPLGNMAMLVSDPRHPWTLGLVLPPPVEEKKGEAEPLTAAERVQRFYKTASRTARELAGLVAVAPVVSLHVLRLIRASLLPQARQVHETEVLLGGLLHAPRTPQELIPSEDQPLAFHDGVADLLLDAVPTPRWPAVLRTVSEFVDDSVGTTHGLLHSFRALLEAPRGEITPGNIEHPFLQLAVKRLMRLGGEYAACARRWQISFSKQNETANLYSASQLSEATLLKPDSPRFEYCVRVYSTSGQIICSHRLSKTCVLCSQPTPDSPQLRATAQSDDCDQISLWTHNSKSPQSIRLQPIAAPSKVFIAHKTVDENAAALLSDFLGQHGVACTGLNTHYVDEAMERELRSTAAVLIVMSKLAATSRYVRLVVQLAVERGLPIVVARLDEQKLAPPNYWPSTLLTELDGPVLREPLDESLLAVTRKVLSVLRMHEDRCYLQVEHATSALTGIIPPENSGVCDLPLEFSSETLRVRVIESRRDEQPLTIYISADRVNDLRTENDGFVSASDIIRLLGHHPVESANWFLDLPDGWLRRIQAISECDLFLGIYSPSTTAGLISLPNGFESVPCFDGADLSPTTLAHWEFRIARGLKKQHLSLFAPGTANDDGIWKMHEEIRLHGRVYPALARELTWLLERAETNRASAQGENWLNQDVALPNASNLVAELVASVSGSRPTSRTGDTFVVHWRKQLPEGLPVRLGREPVEGWETPWDKLISRTHAELLWDGGRLHVSCLNSARNPIYFHEQSTRECSLEPGESFQIGHTRFQLSRVPRLGSRQSAEADEHEPEQRSSSVPNSAPPAGSIKNSIGMKLAAIPAGEFLMGSPEDEPERLGSEGPQHRVRISHAFHMGIFPVTQREYELVMGQCPAHFRNLPDSGNLPMESVSWKDAVQFCFELSLLPEERLARRVYRLPTEAEWEYACRGGTQTPFAFGSSLSSAQANVQGTKFGDASSIGQRREQTTAVGSFPANGFGLHDMHGNVGEWCADIFDAEYYLRAPAVDPKGPDVVQAPHVANLHPRVVRGGHWNSISSSNCRSARRGKALPDTESQYDGFRVVMTYGDIPEQTTEGDDGRDEGVVGNDSAPEIRALFRDAEQLARECQRRLEISMSDGILDLGDLPLTVLPPGIRTATWLTVLALGDQKPCRNSGVLEWSARRAQCVVTDLRPLAALPNLIALDLGSCSDISRLDPLADLKSLQFLNLHRCSKITDLQPLAGLVQLETLNLTWCESIVDLRPLDDLTALRTLRLRGCTQLAYLPQTKNFPNLSVLDLTGCDQLLSLSPLAPLKALEVLELARCRRIANLGPLAGLKKLRSLDLSVCPLVADLSPLRSLTALQTLNLSGCGEIESIEPLSGMKQLQSLNLWDCKSVTDLEPLAHLDALTELDLRRCGRVKDLRPLARLQHLTSLDLQFTSAGSFAPIAPLLPQLTSLKLHGTRFADLDPSLTGDWNENVIDKVREWSPREPKRKAGESRDDNSLGIKLVWCPPGKFTMGSPKAEADRSDNETQVQVTLSDGFWMSQTVVTQKQWVSVMGTKPWMGKARVREGNNYPATYVCHSGAADAAKEFCERLTLSEREAERLPLGLAYRLPTEAEWEYACRAGTRTAFGHGDKVSELDPYAWFWKNAWDVGQTEAIWAGGRQANAWGLLDMHGNVNEWCIDCYAVELPGGENPCAGIGSLRVCRGGCWYDPASNCRSAYRNKFEPVHRGPDVGFRLVLAQS